MTQSNKLLTIFFEKNNLNTMTQRTPTKNIIAEIEKWTGGPVPNLVWNGKWTTSWGKGNRFRFLGHPGQKYGVIFDWSDGRKELFYIEDFSGKIEIPKPPEIKDITDEFNALQNATTHPYATQKNITLPPGLKIKGNNLVVPLYSMDTHTIISWQEIFPQKDKDGKNKKFKANCPLTGGVYFMIGEKTKEVFACEGLATGVSINKITNKQVLCCFTIHSLDKLCTHLLSKKKYNKVVQAVDNDGPNTHKTKIKDPRFEVVCPDKPGDFNDWQDDILEQCKLTKSIKTEDEIKEETQLTQKEIIEYMKEMHSYYYKLTDHSKKVKVKFWDHQKLIAQKNATLVSGGTECGKTGFSLSFAEDMLKRNKKVIIWEHSEMNRGNRLNAWLEETELIKQGKLPIITKNKKEVLRHIKKDNIIIIDDTDSFFQIQRPTNRREVADTLEDISYICQYAECTIILSHYQTKTSRGETDIQLRSGGDMTWVNKIRYALIIEKSTQQKAEVDEKGKKELKKYERSYVVVQKGHRPKCRIEAYWLNKNFRPSEAIKKSTLEKVLRKKTNPQVGQGVLELNKFTFKKLQELKGKYLAIKFYKDASEDLGVPISMIKRLLRMSNYKSEQEGFGPGSKYYIVSKFKEEKNIFEDEEKNQNPDQMPEKDPNTPQNPDQDPGEPPF